MTACVCLERERLEEEIAYLRSELGIQVSLTDQASLRREYGMPRGDAALALRLYNAHGRVVSAESLEESIPSRHGGPVSDRCVKIVDVYICRIRKALGFEAIATACGLGYQMTPAGQEKIRRALETPVALAA